MRLRNILVGAICASMLVVAPASAQNAAQSGYSSPKGSIQEQISTRDRDPRRSTTVTTTTNTRTSEASGGDLPFTGLDVMLVMAAGGVLLAMGVGMRRLSRSEVA